MTKAGYTFTNWTNASTEAIVSSPVTVTADLTLNANYTANTHKLAWDFAEGATTAVAGEDYTEGGDAVAYGTAITYPAENTMSKSGFDFAGWSTSVTSMPDADLTITAQWVAEATKYDITYAVGDYEDYASLPENVNASNVTLAALVSDNKYRFDGWKANIDVKNTTLDGETITAGTLIAAGTKVYVTSNATFTAQWTPKYAVSFNTNGGSAVATQYIISGETAEAPAAPTKDGYLFKAWQLAGVDYNFETAVSADIELVAAWNEVETYTYNCDNEKTIAELNAEGWAFTNNGYDADSKATVDLVATLNTNGQTAAKTNKMDDNALGYLKNAEACATFDLGQTTTVTGINVTLYGGSSSAFNETITFVGADGTTVKKTYTNSLSAGNWKANNIVKTEQVADVRYIKVYGASKYVVMYAFSVSYVNTITKYNVTFDANGGEGEMNALRYAEGAEVTLPECTFTAPTSKEFDAWTSEDVEIANNKFTMPAKNVVIKATWKDEISRYTVVYKDGESELGSEIVEVGEHPTASEIETSKDYYTFAAWQLNEEDVALSAVEGTKGATVTLVARYEKNYASSINIEQLVLDKGTQYDITTALANNGFVAVDIDALDTLNDLENKANRNYAFLGLKVKKATSAISLLLKSGSTLRVKFGNVGNNVNFIIGDAEPVAKTADDLKNAYEYTATADVVVKIQSTGTKTVVLKQIMIDDAIADVTLPTPEAYLVNLAAVTNGTIDVNWDDKQYRAPVGATVTITATPASGYKIVRITVDGETIEPVEDKYSFIMPAKEVTVSAIFDTATAITNTSDAAKAQKRIENGQLVIEKNGKVFNAMGQTIR